MAPHSYAAWHAARKADEARAVDSRLDALEARLREVSSILALQQAVGPQDDLYKRLDQAQCRIDRLEAQLAGPKERLDALERRVDQALKENQYVHQHNALVLTQLTDRLKLMEQAQEQPSQTSRTAAPPLAPLVQQLRHLADTQAVLQDDCASLGRELSVTWAHVRGLEQQLRTGLSELRATVDRVGMHVDQKLAATPPEERQSRHPAQPAAPSATTCTQPERTSVPVQEAAVATAAAPALEAPAEPEERFRLMERVNALEVHRVAAKKDAQRAYQYAGLVAGLQASMHAAVGQLQAAWPVVHTALAGVQADLQRQRQGGPEGGGQAGSSHLAHRAMDVAAAQQAARHVQSVMDLLSQQMTTIANLTAVANKRLGGSAPSILALSAATEEAVDPSGAQGMETALHGVSSLAQQLAGLLIKAQRECATTSPK